MNNKLLTITPRLAATFSRRVSHLLMTALLFTSSLTSQPTPWQARNQGLVGKSIYAFWLCKSGTILAGSSNGDIFRSTDDGLSWTRMRKGRLTIAVGDPETNKVQAFAEKNNGMILAGTNQGELARSINDGRTWTSVPLSPFTPDIRDIQITAEGDVYLATYNYGLLRLHYGKRKWEVLNLGLMNQRTLSLLSSGKYLYVGTLTDGAIRTTDNGSSWQVLRSGLIDYGTTCWPLLQMTTNSLGEIVAVTGASVFYLRPGDTSWFRPDKGGFYVDGLTKKGPSILAFGKMSVLTPLAESNDVTHGWRQISTNALKSNLPRTAASYTAGGSLLVGVQTDGVYRTSDRGRSWKLVNDGLTNGYILSLSPATQSETIYAGTYSGGVYKTIDGGITWKNVGLRARSILSIAASARYIFATTTPDPHARTHPAEFLRSDDEGQTWSKFSPAFENSHPTSIAIGMNEEVYLGTNGQGVLYSSNSGEHWEARYRGLADPVVNALTVSKNDEVCAATPSGVFRSKDRGKNWVASGLQNLTCLAVAFDQKNTLFVGTEERGLYINEAATDRWKQATLPLSKVNLIAVDSKGNVIAGERERGLYRSTKSGKSWFKFVNGLPSSVTISSITSTSGGVVIGTVGDGIFRNGAVERSVVQAAARAQQTERAAAQRADVPTNRMPPQRTADRTKAYPPDAMPKQIIDAGSSKRMAFETIVHTGHTDQIRSAVFSPDDRWAATASADKTFRVWDVATGKLFRSFRVDEFDCYAVAFSPDGKFLVGGGQQSLWLMDLETGVVTRHSSQHGFFTALAFSPDGSALVSGHLGGTILLWDPTTMRITKTLDQTSFSGMDITSLCFLDSSKTMLRINKSGTIGILDVETGKASASISAFPSTAQLVYVNRSGRKLAATVSEDNAVEIWDLDPARIIRSIPEAGNNTIRVAFAAEGTIVLTAHEDNSLNVWGTFDGLHLQSVDLGGNADCIAVSHQGTDIAISTGKTLRFWRLNWPRKTEDDTLLVKRLSLPGAVAKITSLDFTNIDRTITIARSDFKISMLRIAEPPGFATWIADSTRIMGVSSNPVTPSIATLTRDFSVSLWNPQSGAKMRMLMGKSTETESRVRSHGIATSPDGKMLASIQPDATVKLWDNSNSLPISTLIGHKFEVEAVAFSPDSKLVATGGYEGSIMLWSTNDGKNVRILQRHRVGVRALTFSPRGDLLASAGVGDQLDDITVWDPIGGFEIRSLGRNLPWVGPLVSYLDGDFEMLASGHGDGTIRIWNMQTGEFVSKIDAHAGGVNGLAIWQKGSILISGSEDGTIRLWNSHSGAALATIFLLGDRDWVATTPEGYFDGTLEGIRQVHYIADGKLSLDVNFKSTFRRAGLLNLLFNHPLN